MRRQISLPFELNTNWYSPGGKDGVEHVVEVAAKPLAGDRRTEPLHQPAFRIVQVAFDVHVLVRRIQADLRDEQFPVMENPPAVGQRIAHPKRADVEGEDFVFLADRLRPPQTSGAAVSGEISLRVYRPSGRRIP